MKPSIKILLWVGVANLLLSYTVQFFACRNERITKEAITPILDRATAEGVDSVKVVGTTEAGPKDIFLDYLGKKYLTINIYDNNVVPEMEYADRVLVIKTNPESQVEWKIYNPEE